MIARMWHGWTSRDNAGAYESLLRGEILPGIHRVSGHRGAVLLRRDAGDEVEFVTVTWFESMDAVREFAGADWERAVVPPAARRLALLSRHDHLPFDQRRLRAGGVGRGHRPGLRRGCLPRDAGRSVGHAVGHVYRVDRRTDESVGARPHP